ncbi:DNA-binding protein [Ciceribacter sp. RN22]|uniref:DNA-binding protein n=1 Tax=Ciceribacter sp. RN22 TaxID=2954932 RepID=UPI002093E253|nr:DNA-binding protein [Ciceribacter sp. RN22]MCO6180270.1 DNA-binding protein [Ciceribacter sp. RN22]
METTDVQSDDLVWGANAIARVINRTDRQTFHMLDAGELPAKKVGGRWVASRKKLLEFLIGEAA